MPPIAGLPSLSYSRPAGLLVHDDGARGRGVGEMWEHRP
jgi:hypothetical protein